MSLSLLTTAVVDTLHVLIIILRLPIDGLLHAFGSFVWRPTKSLKDDIVFITGGASGIGLKMAHLFAKEAKKVVIADLNGDAARKAAQEVNEAADADVAVPYQCDVTDRKAVYRLADQVKAEVGNVTVLVNNAGIVTGKTLLECPDELMEKTMQVNAISHFWTLKAFLPDMMEKNHGHIVTIASSAGLVGVPGLVDYCASKHAAVGLNESLRLELHKLGKHGVHTTCVCPGFIDTGMFTGAYIKWAFLFPILSPDYAAYKIIDAVKSNQTLLCMPRFIGLNYLVRSLAIPERSDEILRLMGPADSMDNFVGRQKSKSQ